MRKPLFFLFKFLAKKRQANQRQSFFDIFRLKLSGEALFKVKVKKNIEENLAKASY
jgi:hypothetical protein